MYPRHRLGYSCSVQCGGRPMVFPSCSLFVCICKKKGGFLWVWPDPGQRVAAGWSDTRVVALMVERAKAAGTCKPQAWWGRLGDSGNSELTRLCGFKPTKSLNVIWRQFFCLWIFITVWNSRTAGNAFWSVLTTLYQTAFYWSHPTFLWPRISYTVLIHFE